MMESKENHGREWSFYMVGCRDDSLYSGITNDLEARLKEHNRGTGAKYTLGRRPVTLVYSERCSSVSEARKREAQVKKWPKTKKEQLAKGVSEAPGAQ
jgi:putative endonuclease